MRGSRRIALLLVASLMLTTLGGCSSEEQTVMGENHYVAAKEGMESTPIIEYTLPRATANVLVDRLGYPSLGNKEAAIKGKELPEEFCLVNADSKEVVYTGSVEKIAYIEEAGSYLGYAVFEDYEEPGNYYLECKRIGRSHTFSIGEKHYIGLFEELTEVVLADCKEQTATVAEVTALLTAYEWYPELFRDGDENEVPDILEQLADWLAEWELNAVQEGEEALRAALLAKYSYLYQKYDKKYATACLQKASALFEQTKAGMSKDAESFFALTELYRASGLSTYRKQIAEYKSYFEGGIILGSEWEYLYGAMTYMVTRQKVDLELCNILLDKMMERGEEISERYEAVIHPVSPKNNGAEEILSYAIEVVFVNYVLNSYQYNSVLEEFLHYLGGRNLQSVSFYPGEEDCTAYILMLAQLASMPTEDGE